MHPSEMKLTDMQLFADLEVKLNALTPEQLERLRPPKQRQGGIVVIGQLTPALKAMMYLGQVMNEATAVRLATLLVERDSMSPEELENAYEEHARMAKQAATHLRLFWSAVRREFTDGAGKYLGIGPEFEVYLTNSYSEVDRINQILNNTITFSVSDDGSD